MREKAREDRAIPKGNLGGGVCACVCEREKDRDREEDRQRTC